MFSSKLPGDSIEFGFSEGGRQYSKREGGSIPRGREGIRERESIPRGREKVFQEGVSIPIGDEYSKSEVEFPEGII